MRERVKVLRETREQDRQAIVEQKRYDQWMRNNEELRTLKSKQEHQVHHSAGLALLDVDLFDTCIADCRH